MLRKLTKYLREGDHFAGLEITNTGGQDSYSYLEVKREGDELQVIKTFFTRSWEQILKEIKAELPLCVQINNDKVLTKFNKGYLNDEHSLVLQAFPNLEITSFYYEILDWKDQSMISIVKKSHLEEILELLHSSNLKPVRLQLGYCSLNLILPYLDSNSIYTSNAELEIINHRIVAHRPTQKTETKIYKIDQLEIQNTQLLAFSGIVSFLQRSISISNFQNQNQQLARDFFYNKSASLLVKILLTFFLLGLMTNFLIFDYYHDKASQLSSSLELMRDQHLNYLELEESLGNKQDKLELLNASAWSKTSFYLDGLAKNLPESIFLDQMTYQPLAMPVRDNKPIRYTQGKIHITGRSINADSYSVWIEELEELPWISNVETTDYGIQKGNQADFILEITLYEIQS